MVCYPLSLFYLLLPLAWSLGIFCLLHLWLAGFCMYLLAYHWTTNRLAAALAGAAYAFNGFTLNCLMWPHIMAALAWMPLVVLTVERARLERGGRFVAFAAFAGTLQMLTGAPEIILFTWLLAGALWAADLFQNKSTRDPSTLRLAWIILLVSGLSAIQLLPFLDLLAHSQRENNYAEISSAMPAYGWANFFVPLFRCYQSPAGVFSNLTRNGPLLITRAWGF